MINPCSVPKFLRYLIKEETPAQQLVCQMHDEAYGRGGDSHARAIADAHLLLGMLYAGMDYTAAEMYWGAVRQHGESHWAHAGPWNWGEVTLPEAP